METITLCCFCMVLVASIFSVSLGFPLLFYFFFSFSIKYLRPLILCSSMGYTFSCYSPFWVDLQRDWAELKKELQEQRDHVRILTLDKKNAFDSCMKQVEDMRKELQSSCKAASDAESRAAILEVCWNLFIDARLMALYGRLWQLLLCFISAGQVFWFRGKAEIKKGCNFGADHYS